MKLVQFPADLGHNRHDDDSSCSTQAECCCSSREHQAQSAARHMQHASTWSCSSSMNRFDVYVSTGMSSMS
jgi:hypothetical protein